MPSVRLATLLLVLLASLAQARVGGGHHYSSPSRSGASHPSNWGGASRPSGVGAPFPSPQYGRPGFSPAYVVFNPGLVLSLMVLAIVVLVLLRRVFGATAATQRALAEQDAIARLHITATDRRAWVASILQRDPSFAEGPFLERVRSLFLVTQDAWSHGDLVPVRRFLSDATWLRFRVQLALLRAQGVRNVTADVEVVDATLVGFEQNDSFETLHVAISARARDVDAPAQWPETKLREAAAQAQAQAFAEVWSLVRKSGVQSPGNNALEARKCPSCGAPFDGGAASNCSYCRAVVNSGAYDWVLAEITQAVEARRVEEAVPGLVAIRRRDPSLSLEVLEDRASLVFWRWVEAQSTGQPETLVRLAQPAAIERLRSDVQRLAEQRSRRVFLECAVGEVRVRAFEEAPPDGTLAHIEVRWSARTGVGPLGQPPPRLPILPQRWVFTLIRASDSMSRVGQGMSTDRCPECGGPLGDGLDPKCQWCDRLLAGNLRDWTLAEAVPVEVWEARARFDPAVRPSPALGFPDVEERERLLYAMAAMALADGVVDARERRLLLQCAEKWGLSPDHVDTALSVGPDALETLLPRHHSGEPFLRALAQLAAVDGKVDSSERRILEAVAARLDLAERLPSVLASVGAN